MGEERLNTPPSDDEVEERAADNAADIRDVKDETAAGVVAAATEKPLTEAQIARNLYNHIKRRLSECAKLLDNPMLKEHDNSVSVLDGLLATIDLDRQAMKAVASSQEMSPQAKIAYMKRQQRAIDKAVVSFIADFFIKRYSPRSNSLTSGSGYHRLDLTSHYLTAIGEGRYFDEVQFKNKYTQYYGGDDPRYTYRDRSESHTSKSPYHFFKGTAEVYSRGESSDKREEEIAPLLRFVVDVLEEIWREDNTSADQDAA